MFNVINSLSTATPTQLKKTLFVLLIGLVSTSLKAGNNNLDTEVGMKEKVSVMNAQHQGRKAKNRHFGYRDYFNSSLPFTFITRKSTKLKE